jgi:hypothetical protein
MFIDRQTIYGFKNETGQEIPPFGCVVITNAVIEEGEIVFNVRKVTQADEDLQEPATLLFNSVQPVPDDSYGVGTRDLPLQALIEQTSDHTSGTVVGPKNDSFALATIGSCFKVLAKDGTDPHVQSGHGVYFIEGYYGKTDFHIGTTTSAITGISGGTLGTGTVMLKKISSSNTLVNDREVTVKNPSTSIANAKMVFVWRTRNDYTCVEIC